MAKALASKLNERNPKVPASVEYACTTDTGGINIERLDNGNHIILAQPLQPQSQVPNCDQIDDAQNGEEWTNGDMDYCLSLDEKRKVMMIEENCF